MSDKYKKLSKEELLRLVEKQEEELKTKKYGLVWDSEREPEQVVLDCEENLPILKRAEGKEIKTDDSDDNILIEGDNYHALTVLNYTHKESIDVVYIDPPYNTGKSGEWKYNDKYVDENDGYRHSKWLNFMEKRLKLAKRVLSNKGVIFISIDDNEIYQLKLLCDSIFGEKNFVQSFMWLHGKGKKDRWSRTLQQYILCYAKNKERVPSWSIANTASYNFTNPDNDSRGSWFSGSISFSEKRSNPEHENFYMIVSPSGIKWERQWQVPEDEMKQLLKEDKIYWGPEPDYKNVPRIKIFPGDVSEQIPPNIIESVSTRKAQKELDKIFEGKKVFEYPKPIALMKYILNFASRKDSIILDFFAGTGTTGHAVLELNQEDGGDRKFILSTNNEDNNGDGLKIATDICYPRIKKAIEGYKNSKEKVEGLGGNLQYFKTSFVKKTKNSDQLKLNLTQKCTQMLCAKENIYNLEKKGEDYKIFSSNNKDRYLCIYYNFIDDSFDKFLKELGKIKKEKKIYMFSIDNEVDKSLFERLENFSIEPIPQPILDIYRQLIRLNINNK